MNLCSTLFFNILWGLDILKSIKTYLDVKKYYKLWLNIPTDSQENRPKKWFSTDFIKHAW